MESLDRAVFAVPNTMAAERHARDLADVDGLMQAG